jgi:hypothetical protein
MGAARRYELERLMESLQAHNDNPLFHSNSQVWNEVPTGNIDGINNRYLLNYQPDPPTSLMLFMDGTKQEPGTGSFATYQLSGRDLLIYRIPLTGAIITCSYQYNRSIQIIDFDPLSMTEDIKRRVNVSSLARRNRRKVAWTVAVI